MENNEITNKSSNIVIIVVGAIVLVGILGLMIGLDKNIKKEQQEPITTGKTITIDTKTTIGLRPNTTSTGDESLVPVISTTTTSTTSSTNKIITNKVTNRQFIIDAYDCGLVYSKKAFSKDLTYENCVNLINPKTGESIPYEILSLGEDKLYKEVNRATFTFKEAIIKYKDLNNKEIKEAIYMRTLSTDEEAGRVVTTLPRSLDTSHKIKISLNKTNLGMGESATVSYTIEPPYEENIEPQITFEGDKEAINVKGNTITVEKPFAKNKLCATVYPNNVNTFGRAYIKDCVEISYKKNCNDKYVHTFKHDLLDRTNGHSVSPVIFNECPGTYSLSLVKESDTSPYDYIRIKANKNSNYTYAKIDDILKQDIKVNFGEGGTIDVPIGIKQIKLVKTK